MISMIKAKLSFFLTFNSEGHGSHGNKGTILFLGSVNVHIYKTLFCWNKLSESKVIDI